MKLTVLFLAALLLPLFSAHAQYEVMLEMDKIDYVAQEPMKATVTITNRSGTEVILGGPKGKSWLMFNVKDSMDRSLSPAQLTSDEPVVLPAGERVRRSVQLGETHSITEPGTYSITVSAYHPPSGEYYISNRKRFTITEPKPFGKPLVFGVPEGYPGAGRVRRHTLMVHRDVERMFLYYRLVDDRSGEKLATYQLGPLISAREPQFTLDKNNSLHVMFLATTQESVHYTIGPDGKPKALEYYRDGEGTRPQLFLTKENTVVAAGGKLFDPAREEADRAAAASRVRKVSERPPGL